MTASNAVSPPIFNDEVIARIILGAPPFSDLHDFGEISEHIFKSIKNLTREIIYIKSADAPRFSLLGPFLGRSLLETCLTAIVGRIDPYRLLVVRHQQIDINYDPSTKRLASPQWTGDILSEKPSNELLNAQKKYQDLSRALLSDHYDTLLWKPALTRIFDKITQMEINGPWIAEIQNFTAEDFIPKQRTNLTRLYSKLSKGIHHEFVIPPDSLYDRSTVASMLSDSVQSCCILGTVANFIGHISRSIPVEENLNLLNMAASFEIN